MGCLDSKEEVYAEEDQGEVLEIARKAFAKHDRDDSGQIEAKELGGLIAEIMGKRMSPLELEEALKVLDADGSGTISWREFRQWFLSNEDDEGAVLRNQEAEAEAAAAEEVEAEAEDEEDGSGEDGDEGAGGDASEDGSDDGEGKPSPTETSARDASQNDGTVPAAPAPTAAVPPAREPDSSDEEAGAF
mmetsp:Transcript_95127/g.264322  ORF Transcript_95127/g.264322 Transcript_95127/m.264322 type:complete len:189 (+) Transcript_95127:118-684(+)